MVTKYKTVKTLEDKGFPTDSRYYESAHRQADKVEKERNPKEYEAMKKVDEKLPKGQLAGKNLASGKIEISAKVPKKFREPIAANHEKVENENIKRMEKKARK